MQKKTLFLQKYLVNSKKSSTFAVRFEPLAIALGAEQRFGDRIVVYAPDV